MCWTLNGLATMPSPTCARCDVWLDTNIYYIDDERVCPPCWHRYVAEHG
jgi:hypothetical protein